jgi:hypothetical protein
MLTRDEMIWGFRCCLGHDPKSEDAVAAHQNPRDPDSPSYPDPYAGEGERAICRDGAIAYDAGRRGVIAESVLFFGPYICPAAGVYLLCFIGEVRGSLIIRSIHRSRTPLAEVAVENFDEPLCLVS